MKSSSCPAEPQSWQNRSTAQACSLASVKYDSHCSLHVRCRISVGSGKSVKSHASCPLFTHASYQRFRLPDFRRATTRLDMVGK